MASLEFGTVVTDPSTIDQPFHDGSLQSIGSVVGFAGVAASSSSSPRRTSLSRSTQRWSSPCKSPREASRCTPLSQIASAPGFISALWLSTQLAVITMVAVMLLMVPTVIYVHLRMPRFRRVMEVITILPIIIPPIAYATGVLESAPAWLRASQYLLAVVYVVLAMPYVYRSLDSGLGALDLKTLVEASRSLGSGWLTTIVRVLVPNLRAALMSASVLDDRAGLW